MQDNIRQSQDQWPNSSLKLLWANQEDADSLTHMQDTLLFMKNLDVYGFGKSSWKIVR